MEPELFISGPNKITKDSETLVGTGIENFISTKQIQENHQKNSDRDDF
jgi:hypothetical protein